MPDEAALAVIITGGILVGLVIVVALPAVLGIRLAARQRELEHQERMKALELGRPWPGEKALDGETSAESSPERGVRIGVWVPLGALGIAFAATSSQHNGESLTHMAIWISAAAVGVAGVICGTILAFRTPRAADSPPTPRFAHKPALEEDALDIVSRRG